MNGANLTLRTPPAPNGQSTDLQNLNLPAPAALAGGISKALTSVLLLVGRRGLLEPHRQRHRPGDLPAVRRHPRPGKRPAVQRPVQPAALLGRLVSASRTAPAPIAARSASAPIRAPSRSTRTARWSASVAAIGDGVYGFDTEYRDNDRNVEEIDRARRDHRLRAAAEIRANRIIGRRHAAALFGRDARRFPEQPRQRPGLRDDQRHGRQLCRGPRLLRRRGDRRRHRSTAARNRACARRRPAEFNDRRGLGRQRRRRRQPLPVRAGTDAATAARRR